MHLCAFCLSLAQALSEATLDRDAWVEGPIFEKEKKPPYRESASSCQLCLLIVDNLPYKYLYLADEPAFVKVSPYESTRYADQRRLGGCNLQVGNLDCTKYTQIYLALWTGKSELWILGPFVLIV